LSGGITNYTTLIRRLRSATVGTGTHLCIVSLNFDLLLEAACQMHWGFNPSQFGDYVAADVSVLKPHGSVQWSWVVDSQRTLRRSSADRMVIESAVGRLDQSVWEVVDMPPHDPRYDLADAHLRVPALALPIAEKTELAWPPQQEERLESFHGVVHRVLTIGWRAAEPHFVRLLEPLVSPGTKMVVVTGEGEAQETLDNLSPVAVKAANIRRVESGFSGLLNGDDLDWLLGDDDSPWIRRPA
jgi:hypothetical protein